MLGMHLALRGGVEHEMLRRPRFNCQIRTEIDEDTGKEMLVYVKDPSQNTKSCGKLYLRPMSKPTPAVWFCDQPYGKNKIGNTVKICVKL